jgi:hypothetical protein
VVPWFSSRDLLPPSCSSVRHLLSPKALHETTLPSSLTHGLAPAAGLVRPSSPQNHSPLSTSTQNPAPISQKLPPNLSCLRSLQLLCHFSEPSP